MTPQTFKFSAVKEKINETKANEKLNKKKVAIHMAKVKQPWSLKSSYKSLGRGDTPQISQEKNGWKFWIGHLLWVDNKYKKSMFIYSMNTVCSIYKICVPKHQ